MRTKSFILPALLAVAVPEVASQNCDQTDLGQCLVGFVGYFSDENCANSVGGECLYAGDVNQNCAPDLSPNSFQCFNDDLPPGPFFAKISDAQFDSMQVEFYANTNDCTSTNRPGSVSAIVNNNNACTKVVIGGPNHGVLVAPQGFTDSTKRSLANSTALHGAAAQRMAARELAMRQLEARDDLQCNGWQFGSQQEITTNPVRVSDNVVCPMGNGTCSIIDSKQHTTSVTTMYSVTAGGSVSGLTASATFGMSFTDSEATTIQENVSVPEGSTGFLQVFSQATQFTGTYTECNTSTGKADGVVTAIKSNTLTYTVTTTG